MKPPSVAVVGYGLVGQAITKLFPGAVVYDEPLGIGTRADVNKCTLAFVAVPTPSDDEGRCDTAIVEEVVGWIESDIIILRSTVPVGTTDRLKGTAGKRIVFQPEYGPGSDPEHPYADVRNVRWVLLGGDRPDTSLAADLYKTAFNSEIAIHQTDARTAELTKYVGNAFLAMKVAFCNEICDIAEELGIEYDDLREFWLLDPRVGRSHTFVLPHDRGFGGPCLPKDLSELVHTARAAGCPTPLLASVLSENRRRRH